MRSLEDIILTIGPDYKPPKGGIAQTISNYDRLIFRDKFKYVPNSTSGSFVRKLIIFVVAYLRCIYFLSQIRESKLYTFILRLTEALSVLSYS